MHKSTGDVLAVDTYSKSDNETDESDTDDGVMVAKGQSE